MGALSSNPPPSGEVDRRVSVETEGAMDAPAPLHRFAAPLPWWGKIL